MGKRIIALEDLIRLMEDGGFDVHHIIELDYEGESIDDEEELNWEHWTFYES